MSKQVGLHVHSELSTLDGFSKVSDIPKRARELGQQAVGLTDHGECAGHVKFQKACREEGIKPLFGMEGYHHPDIAAAMAAVQRNWSIRGMGQPYLGPITNWKARRSNWALWAMMWPPSQIQS